MSMQKRQREIKKAEKAARKRAKRHGLVLERPAEPLPTLGTDALFGPTPPEPPEGETSEETSPEEEPEVEKEKEKEKEKEQA
jgi:hypothetical protein